MPDQSPLEIANLYVDIDDVFIAKKSPFKTVELFPDAHNNERYSPEVARRLGATGMHIFILSTWSKNELSPILEIEGLREATVLELAPTDEHIMSITKKRRAFLANQKLLGGPFVRIDDQLAIHEDKITKSYAKEEKIVLGPALFIRPDRLTGLNNDELLLIEACAQARTAREWQEVIETARVGTAPS